MMNKNNKELAPRSFSEVGFTLIELLVVISIISGLSALILPNFMTVREKARDTQRKSDIRSIQQSLEMYRQNQPVALYPTSYPAVGETWSSESEEVLYMKKVPGDPIYKTDTTQWGYYYAPSDSGTAYVLCACVENKGDPSATTGNCEDTSYICDSGYKYSTTEP